MWKRRISITLGIVLVLILSLSSLSVFAGNQKNDSLAIQPRFTYINYLYSSLSVSDMGEADAYAQLDAKSADSVKLEIILQQNLNGQWIDIKSWSATSAETDISLNKSYYVYSGYQYRSIATGYVHIDGDMVEQSNCISNVVEY